MQRQAKRNHFKNLRIPNAKRFGKALRYVKIIKNSCHLPTLQKDCIMEATTNLSIATILNTAFTENFNRSIPCLSQHDFHNFSTNHSVCPDYLLCNEEEVLMILSLDTHTSSGPAWWNINSYAESYTATSTASSLTMLFSLSISSCSIPSEWEPSLVVPIPKTKHPSSNPGHYCPISLLSVTSKLLERHIHGLILDHRHMHTAWFPSHSGALSLANILPLLSLPHYTTSCS